MAIDDWFLSTDERGNPWTRLSHRHGGRSWTSGNDARLHVHGVGYFARLREVVEAQGPGDLLLFTDWRGDPDERLGEDGLTVAELFAGAARRGVVVKGLFWRSHLDTIAYSEEENRSMADDIREAGGEVLLDMRVLPLGSHHQKFVVLRHPDRPEKDVAFVGGIDLCHTRRDDRAHLGDPQTVKMGDVWGSDARLARRDDRGARPGRRGCRGHLPGAVGGPDAARAGPYLAGGGVGAPRRRARRPASAAAARPRTQGGDERAGAADVPSEAAAVPVRPPR